MNPVRTGGTRSDESDRVYARELHKRLERNGRAEWVGLSGLRASFGGHSLSRDRRREIARALHAAGVDVYPPLDRRTTRGTVRLEAIHPLGPEHPPHERARSLWTFLRARLLTPFGAGLTFVATLVTLAGVFGLPRSNSARPPAVTKMSGDVNVALAPFTVSGHVTPDGEALAFDAASDLRAKLPKLDGSLSFRVRGPDEIPPLAGRSAAAQASAARALAHRIGADIVVYGELVRSPDSTRLMPLFQLNTDKLPSARALAGDYGYGEAISVPYSLDVNPQARAQIRRALTRRTEAYAAAIVGVGDYLTHSLTRAERLLRRARAMSVDTSRIPLLDLMLGNVAAQQHDFAAAARAYAIAARAPSTRARGRFGLAEVAYQRAHGSCARGHVDAGGLLRARRAFAQILDETGGTKHAVPDPTLRAKVALGLGQIDVCLSASGVTRRWARAQRELAAVVRAYRPALPELRDDAAEAQADIGLGDLALQPKPARYANAAATYQRAAMLTTIPSQGAYFESVVGFAEERLGHLARANSAYRHAASMAGNTRLGRSLAAHAKHLERERPREDK